MRQDDEKEWQTIRAAVESALAEFARRGGKLSEGEQKAVATAIKDSDQPALRAALAGQILLSVWINPEARVKVARGKAVAELVVDRPGVFLIEVVNDAGVKAEVRVKVQAGPETGGLFVAEFVRTPAVGDRLGGQNLQFLLLSVRCREAGRREATLVLDAGQGTQDLGFRSEVPVLFRVSPAQ